jgi:hypothetical protein
MREQSATSSDAAPAAEHGKTDQTVSPELGFAPLFLLFSRPVPQLAAD